MVHDGQAAAVGLATAVVVAAGRTVAVVLDQRTAIVVADQSAALLITAILFLELGFNEPDPCLF